MKTILALHGPPGSGKDSAAEQLVSNHGYLRVSFADPIREGLLKLDPYITQAETRLNQLVTWYGWNVTKREFPEVRSLLQVFGEVGRSFMPNIWVDLAIRKIKATDQNIVVTDMRYRNEQAALNREGYVISIKVERPGFGPVNDHSSEKYDLPVDITLVNNGTVDAWKSLVSDWAKVL